MESNEAQQMRDFIKQYPEASKLLVKLVQTKLDEYGSIEHIDIKGGNVGLQASSRKIAYEMFRDFFLEINLELPKKSKFESMR